MHARIDQDANCDARIAALAGRQYGVITYRQLIGLGLGRGAIAHRIACGRLHRLHVGIYAVGHVAARIETRWMAAVLSCGQRSVLSHRSAAALWGFRSGEGPLADVTVDTRAGLARTDVAIHRSRLGLADRSTCRSIPVTSPARTLVDLARVVDHDELVRAARELQFLRRFNPDEIRDVLARRPHRELARMIDDLEFTETRLEDRFLSLCHRHRLPRPLTQHHLDGKRIDFVWPGQRVAVETDGWQAHGTRSAFQADRTVSNRLQLAGYMILRFTDTDVRRRPAQVASQITAALARRPPSPGSVSA